MFMFTFDTWESRLIKHCIIDSSANIFKENKTLLETSPNCLFGDFSQRKNNFKDTVAPQVDFIVYIHFT